VADKNRDGKDDKTGKPVVAKLVAKAVAVIATPAPVVIAAPAAAPTDATLRTALDLRRRELDGTAGPVGQSGDTSASGAERLLAIDREGVLLNLKRQQDAAKK
jgi:hypothetical protein